MYLDECRTQRHGKTYSRILLRTSFRQDGKVKHKTIANLSHCSPQEIDAIRWALQHQDDLQSFASLSSRPVTTQQGLSVGAVFVLQAIAQQVGIVPALGRSPQARLALWLIIARILDQGSRLSAVRVAGQHAACDLLGMDAFNEDDLYDTLDWLAGQQALMEKRLFHSPTGERPVQLFLYDVTSSYLEGQQNELANYGYNRDKKRGKKQIVIGLLTDEAGDPVSVQVYEGNTADNQTFVDQVKKVQERFGIGEVTMVGDRGMIKSAQIEQLPEGFHYLTALTKPQIQTLLKNGVLQMELFDEEVCEVEETDIRYVLRRNPRRVEEIERHRVEKQQTVQCLVERQNEYLQAAPRARVASALRKVNQKIKKLRMESWLAVEANGRTLALRVDEEARRETARLDGCYVLKTDTPPTTAGAQVIHDRYKDLAQVETAFRTMKTGYLETRPIYLRNGPRTRGHVFVVMLAYKIIRVLREAWKSLDLTVEEGVQELASICATRVKVGDLEYQTVPEPRPLGKSLLQTLGLTLPDVVPSRGIDVATRKKMTPRK
jgi:transposase